MASADGSALTQENPRPTILVVEDDRGIREALATGLELRGYRVVTVADGLEALERVDGLAPALIILDVQMPRMGGVAFAEELRRRGLRPMTPLLLLSGDRDIEQKAHVIGAERWMSKPLRFLALLEAVGALLDDHPLT